MWKCWIWRKWRFVDRFNFVSCELNFNVTVPFDFFSDRVQLWWIIEWLGMMMKYYPMTLSPTRFQNTWKTITTISQAISFQLRRSHTRKLSIHVQWKPTKWSKFEWTNELYCLFHVAKLFIYLFAHNSCDNGCEFNNVEVDFVCTKSDSEVQPEPEVSSAEPEPEGSSSAEPEPEVSSSSVQPEVLWIYLKRSIQSSNKKVKKLVI